MVLKDAECSRCGRRVERLLDGEQTEFTERCPICRRETVHSTICNGGTSCRVFVTDFHSRRWSDEEVQFVRAGVEQDGEPVRDLHTGKAIESRSKYSQDRISERREQLKSAQRRKRGKAPLFCDQRRTTC